MKILIYSPAFYPSIGGLETVVGILGQELTKLGNQVIVVSQTAGAVPKEFLFETVQKPSPIQLLRLTGWCDIYFQANISLKGIWPLLIVRRPWVVTHHGRYERSDGSKNWKDYLKLALTHFAKNISVSLAIKREIPAESVVIPDPYANDVFCELSGVKRDKDLIFVGRLVSDKGCDLLLEALAQLKARHILPTLTVVGSGPDEGWLKQLAGGYGLEGQVDFLGAKPHEEIAKLLNQHRIMVIPSRWHEPFGVVALEGIACGCMVIGSEGGGLKEAIGSCGVLFKNNDLQDLVSKIEYWVSRIAMTGQYKNNVADHLAKHRPDIIAERYVEIFNSGWEGANAI